MTESYYERNKERIKQMAKDKYDKHKEKTLKRRRELYHEKHKEHKKEYYLNNKKKIREEFKEAYNAPDSKKKQYMREYYYKNKDHLNQKRKEYNYIKYHSDKQFNIKTRLRARLRFATLDDYGVKNMEPLLGCTIHEFREHIRSQFAPGMTWDNYSKWEFDHIKPVSDFDLTDDVELKKCYNYTNIRPMWSSKNRTKFNN